MAPETVVVAPGFSQRVGNVIVRVALTRDTEDKNLLRSCECRVFQQKKSTQDIGNDFLGLGFVFSLCGHRFDCLQGSFVQVRFLGNVVLHRLLTQTRGTMKETFLVFANVVLQILPETESNEFQQLSGAVLQLQHT